MSYMSVVIAVPDDKLYRAHHLVTPEFVIKILTEAWEAYRPQLFLH